MSIRYSNSDELRYLKYDNLKQEARIIANYYHDIIHSYGMDCTYYKMSVDLPPEFEKIIKSNNTLKHAYGFDDDPDFSLSCDIITYTEVDDDIFILDKVGKSNNQKINFYFDMTDFATKFMTKLGQFKEYPFKEVEIAGYVNAENKISFESILFSDIMSATVVCDVLTEFDGGHSNNLDTDNLDLGTSKAKPRSTRKYTGGISKNITYPINGIATCLVTEHSTPNFTIPVNEYLARSFKYSAGDGDVATAVYFTYKIYEDGRFEGKLNGTVLYYDLNTVSKFAQNIHPEVGDVISLDTSFGPQIYEITDSNNQNMKTDGLNPLVYKYIWKCEATRRIASYDEAPMSEGMLAVQNQLLQETLSRNSYSHLLEPYSDNSDIVYGGFKGTTIEAAKGDSDESEVSWDASVEYTEGGIVNLITFGNKSSIITDGYNLFFKDIDSNITKISTFDVESPEIEKLPINLRYLKADAGNIYFQNILGNYIKLVGNADISEYRNTISEIEFNEADSTLNKNNMNFYKFSNCKTILFSTQYNLFAKVENKDEYILLA